MKKVLVTGGAGFIAHHLIGVLLKETDWDIVSLDRLDYSGNLNRLHEVLTQFPPSTQKRVKIVFHDLKAELNPQVRAAIGKPNIILHLGAASHVDRSIDFPLEFLQDNTIGTVNALQYARTVDSLERFVYFSTDEVFGPAPQGVFYKEWDRYNSSNPYAASKAAGEEFCVAYENTYKMPITITHTMNVFGERQLPEKYIPMCIRKVRDGQTITIHSDKTRTIPGSRFYIHALDVADALLHILTKVEGGKNLKYNIVGKQEINNLELATMIAEAQGKELKYEMVDFHSSRPGHDLRYALSGELMKSVGWEPKISLTDRIGQMVNWSLENRRWLDI